MYESFYGLTEKPFTLTPDPKYLFLSRAHREALDHLLYGIQQREGFMVVTGDVGTGKTTLCRTLLARLDQGTKTALILNPMVSEDELLRAILHDFGLPAAGTSKKELVDELNRFLLGVLESGQTAILIVDESQALSPRLLEQIRLLSNLETEREKLIQIILVGQLGLLDLLASSELRQLNQRISVRYQLRPLAFQETCQYIYHRLMVAGGSGGITMDPGALRALHRFSGGVPRLINLACDRALLQGFVDHSTHITTARARQAIKSLSEEISVGPAGRSPGRLRPLTVTAMILVAFAGGWLGSQGWGLLSARLPALTQVTPRPGPPVAAPEQPFTVLIDVYATEAEARAVEQKLTERGFEPFVAIRSAPTGERTYGVLVGRFGDLGAATRVQGRLASEEGYPQVKVVRVLDAIGAERAR
jgi:general secretion pathway protein A